ncbi:MAG: metalloregulator ArsR/SmtB family transcription factor [Chloroflexota bacterium]|nr:metalloregulator ArsR/SmtB family transcription factor [Chloroflexota bacterium]
MTTYPTIGFDRAALKEATRFLTALGDPMRLQILYLLGSRGRTNVGDIAGNFLHVSRPAISHHLKVLRDAGVVDSEKIGQEVYYRLERDHIVATLRMLTDAAVAWECPA